MSEAQEKNHSQSLWCCLDDTQETRDLAATCKLHETDLVARCV
jgi:hypothetical protein